MSNSLNQARLLLDALEVSPDVGSSLSTLTSLCSELLRHQEDQELALEALHAALTASQPQGGQEYPHEVVEAVEAIIEILEPIIRDRVANEIEDEKYTIPGGYDQTLSRLTRDGEVATSTKRQAARIARKTRTPQGETEQEKSLKEVWNAGYWAGRNDEQNICHCEAWSEGECACGNYDVKLTPNPYKKD